MGIKLMDTIKCRVWNTDEKKMYYSNDEITNVDTDGDEHDHIKTFIPTSADSYFEIFTPCKFGRNCGDGDFELKEGKFMLCIGAKDSKGKDIYEGDILGFSDKRKKRVMLVKHQIAYCEEYGDYIGFNFDKDLEVIGNIYENPELIEEVSGNSSQP